MGSTKGPTLRPWLLILFGITVSVLIALSVIYSQSKTTPTPPPPALAQQAQNTVAPDLSVDANGLSKATVTLKTNKGTIKYKFYPADAPKTVHRMIELINTGFYNGLTFHRVVPGFVIQGGDPQGNGTGGSGQKLEPEFNNRHHVEGTLAMARAADPASADSQFYISLGTLTHLDHQYTIFGQVIEGLDVTKQIVVGDKIESVTVQ
jgi:cyclophilin family peptidyl-prolyl cis-trans isomerase